MTEDINDTHRYLSLKFHFFYLNKVSFEVGCNDPEIFSVNSNDEISETELSKDEETKDQ